MQTLRAGQIGGLRLMGGFILDQKRIARPRPGQRAFDDVERHGPIGAGKDHDGILPPGIDIDDRMAGWRVDRCYG